MLTFGVRTAALTFVVLSHDGERRTTNDERLGSERDAEPELRLARLVYKVRLTGEVVGKFGKAGKMPKEFGMVNAIDCRTENDLWVGEVWNWRAQRVTLRR